MAYRKSGKVNVRKHPRRLEKGGLVIVDRHTRGYPPSTPKQNSKPKIKSTYERRLKDMDYKAAKRVFPWIEPNGDLDGDGVENKKDCHPFDRKRQDNVCPTCGGKGKQKIHVTEWGKPGEKISEIQCVTCRGKGNVTKEEQDAYDYYQNMWCECPEMEKENAFGTTFYKDGEHPELRKHHYRCNKCGKVTQIG